MFLNRRTAMQLTVLLLPVLFYATAVAALDDRTSGAANRPAASSKMQAPVGHRQPTAADVAREQPSVSDEEREKRDRVLDKRLQICRGC